MGAQWGVAKKLSRGLPGTRQVVDAGGSAWRAAGVLRGGLMMPGVFEGSSRCTDGMGVFLQLGVLSASLGGWTPQPLP